MSIEDWQEETDAVAKQTLALASGMVGLTEREVREAAFTWPGDYPYVLYFLDPATDSGIREASLNPRRVYFRMEDGKVTAVGLI